MVRLWDHKEKKRARALPNLANSKKKYSGSPKSLSPVSEN